MKAGIYDPYLDTLGGGEKYCLTLAEMLLNLGWQVDFFWEGKDFKTEIKKRFDINVDKASFVTPQRNVLEKISFDRTYDLLFFVSDGKIPFMFGKKNVLHFQVPFINVNGRCLLNRLKLSKINLVICNSYFTKKFIDKEFGVKSLVIYPPVAVEQIKPSKKENIILSVGRFSKLLQAKNQELLICSFKRLYDDGLRGWKFILAGGSEVGGDVFVKDLEKQAEGYPIEVLENIPLAELINLYAKAKICWGANGFGVNEGRHPEKVEHFGISVAEAMSAGAIPVLVSKGGFKEIIEDGKSGFFWESPEELEKITLKLTGQKLEPLQKQAIKRSQLFSKEKFYEKFKEIIL